MSNLDDGQVNLLRLIARSPANDDGWKTVSKIVCPLFTAPVRKLPPAELFEFELTETGGRVRLTERGEIVKDYI